MKLEIQEAINWIDGNVTDEITLQKISDFIGYSPYHTSRKFKEYTGSTLRNYIMLRRKVPTYIWFINEYDLH